MNGQGKPEASRELLERMMGSQSLGGSTPLKDYSYMSFAERKRLEERRKLIGSYKSSKLGSVEGVTEELAKNGDAAQINRADTEKDLPSMGLREDSHTDRSSISREKIDTGQNRPSAGFVEPPSRKYNPYS